MAGGNELSYARSVFLPVNAATLTGFQQTVGINDFNPASHVGPAAILTLVVGGTLFSLVAGGLCATRILRLGYDGVRVVVGAVASVTLFTLVGAVSRSATGTGCSTPSSTRRAPFGNCGLELGRPEGADAWRASRCSSCRWRSSAGSGCRC